MSGRNFIYLIPHRNRGKGARNRWPVLLDVNERHTAILEGAWWDGVVRGNVVDHHGNVMATGYRIQREHVRKAHPAVMDEAGHLVIVYRQP